MFERYILNVYRASTMSHQTAPNPQLKAALPPFVVYGSTTLTYLKEN